MTKRDGRALWRALQEQKAEDELDEIVAMSDTELDAFITESGGDAKAIRASGGALAKQLFEQRDRLAWHGDMAQKSEALRKLAAEKQSNQKLPRAELLKRLEAARHDPRFSTPVSALFHKKSTDASTDEELQAMLDQIELLAKLDEEK